MDITYILGNGFDLQLGIHTRYSHFLDWYVLPSRSDNDNIREFKSYLRKSENRTLWSDAEAGMGAHLGSFGAGRLGDYNERVADFETRMIEYLEEEQAKCSYRDVERIKKVFSDFLRGSFQDVLGSRSREIGADDYPGRNRYDIITFNYTDLIDRLVDCHGGAGSILGSRIAGGDRRTDHLGNVCHVHGTLDSQIIMGVNDETQLDLSGGVELTPRLRRQMIKPVLNAQCSHEWDTVAQELIARSDVIAIYGVSYGKTDNIWWERIRAWLRQDEHKLVVFMRDRAPGYNRKILWQEINYEEEKRREALIRLGEEPNSSDLSVLMDRTYIVVNTARLELKDILLGSGADPEESAAAAAAAGAPQEV